MNARKMLPYALVAGAALGLMALSKEAADAYFSIAHQIEPSSLG